MAWHPTHPTPAPVAKLTAIEPIGKTEQTDLNIDPEADHDQFSHFEPGPARPEKTVNPEDLPDAGVPAGTGSEVALAAREVCGGRPISGSRSPETADPEGRPFRAGGCEP